MDTIVMAGYGAKVRTVDGVLVIEHGEPGAREELRLGRSQRKVRHIVIGGRTGYVTLAALRWCEAVGMTVTVLGEDGSPRMVTMTGDPLNGALRRRQAASDGIEVCRMLIARKLEEQLVTLQGLPEEVTRWRRRPSLSPMAGATALEKMAAYLAKVPHVHTLKELAYIESVAARAYWRRIGTQSMSWRGKVPEHWRSVGRRHHPPAEAIRKDGYAGVTPAQALINYAYGYLLAEAIQACYSVGLDPAIGYLHRLAVVDQRGGQRAEFAMDLMEPLRPVVDRQVLALITSRTFTWRDDAIEKPSGGISLSHPLRRTLILSCAPLVRKSLAVIANDVVGVLKRPNRPTVQLESIRLLSSE